jgi:ubiquinone/menaquinone biosynthesis C-methylase UbiE
MKKNEANDYDKYAKLRQEELLKGLSKPHRFVEKPMMKALMPNLDNKKVLMLGCGTGEESILLKSFGAKELVGIDLSSESINLAKDTYSNCEFIVGDMHSMPFEDNSFDFVYSSLTVHYSKEPEAVYKEIYRILKKDGELLFSVAHPLRWASTKIDIDGVSSRIIGYTDNDEFEQRVYGNYSSFKEHSHNFREGEILSFFVAPPSMHFKLLKKSGFSILDFSESRCVEDAKNVDEKYYKRFSEIPQFMAFLAKK